MRRGPSEHGERGAAGNGREGPEGLVRGETAVVSPRPPASPHSPAAARPSPARGADPSNGGEAGLVRAPIGEGLLRGTDGNHPAAQDLAAGSRGPAVGFLWPLAPR